VLATLKAGVAPSIESSRARLLDYRKERGVELGKVRHSCQHKTQALSQAGTLHYYDPQHEDFVKAVKLRIKGDNYSHALALMNLITCHYIAAAFQKEVMLASGCGSDEVQVAVKPFRRYLSESRRAEGLRSNPDRRGELPDPKSQWALDPMCATVVSADPETQLAAYGRLAKHFKLLRLSNTWDGKQDAAVAAGDGMIDIRINFAYAPQLDGKPLTFSVMRADNDGYFAAVQAAKDSAVSTDGTSDETYAMASAFFSSFPGLGDEPIVIISEVVLRLQHFAQHGARWSGPLGVVAASSLVDLRAECLAAGAFDAA